MVQGWIRVYRKLEDNVLWKNNEPFDRRSAWIDLLLMANYKDNEMLFDGKTFVVKCGQCLTSIRKLGVKWSWSKDRVLKFLRLLESIGMITKTSTNKRTLITIVNYEIYQGLLDTDKDTDQDTDKDTDKDTDSPQTINKEYKEGKEGKKDNDVSSLRSDTLSDTSDEEKVKLLWNTLEGVGDIKAIKSIGVSERQRLVKARLKQYGVEGFEKAIEKIKQSDFLQGKNKNGWCITFDWFVKPNNFPKVLEGNYDNKATEKKGEWFK